MLSKDQITAASSVIDETDVAMVMAVIRGSTKYKDNPVFYADIQTRIEDLDGTVQAKMVNAALAAIVDLGIGVVEIDQRRVGGSDGLYYSQVLERNALVDYIIGVMYPEFFESVTIGTDGTTYGSYGVAQREVTELL